MWRRLWNRLVGSSRRADAGRELERESKNPDERRFASESIEDYQADEFVGEHLGGVPPERLQDEDEPPS